MRRRDHFGSGRRGRFGRSCTTAGAPFLAALLLGFTLGCAHHGHAGHHDDGADGRHAAIERLVAIQDIEQLKARFMRCVDTKNLPCLRDEVFAPGAEIHFKGADYDISAVGWTAIEKFYQDAFTTKKFGMHTAHTPEITVSGETARGTWYLHDIFVNLEANTTLQGSALYDDSYARIDGQWRIMYSSYERLWEETTPRNPKTKLGSKSVRE